jgi:hypothetical protein
MFKLHIIFKNNIFLLVIIILYYVLLLVSKYECISMNRFLDIK